MPDNQSDEIFGQTPSQTVGPFFHYGLTWRGGADLVGDTDIGARAELFPPEHYLLAMPRKRAPVAGTVIELHGSVFDGDGRPVPDAMIEIWQADAAGQYAAHEPDGFIGFGRSSTGEDGTFRFRTIKPGAVAAQAPHIAIGVFGRGLLKRLVTRAYFAGAPENAADPILALVPEARRATLMAQGADPLWHLDIVLQGDAETVFFDV
jgi:protocatechuate 3,4-dioxygenase alpha subunit